MTLRYAVRLSGQTEVKKVSKGVRTRAKCQKNGENPSSEVAKTQKVRTRPGQMRGLRGVRAGDVLSLLRRFRKN